MGKIVGIDLGTTNSLLAVVQGKGVEVIKNRLGDNLMRSVVRIASDGSCIVGNAAYRGRVLDPTHTITSIKRLIGRKYNEIFDLVPTFPYNIVIGPNDLACIENYEKLYTPQTISAMILGSLKRAAEDYLGEPVTEAIITVPAYFNAKQKKATIEAGEMAGLTVRRVITEPTAAALAYGLDKTDLQGKIAVFDLGGGTFDVSILEIGDGVFEVVAVSGDGFLGGDDFDLALEKWAIEEIFRQYGVSLTEDLPARALILEAVQKAKIDLSTAKETSIQLPFFRQAGTPMIHISLPLTRSRMEEICEELFERLIAPCLLALHSAELKPEEIQKVILVGGATRMPKIREIILRVFQKEPTRSINPDEAVALGAAIQGGVLTGEVRDALLLDASSRSLGVEDHEGLTVWIIEANTSIPAYKSETFVTEVDAQTSVYINILEGENALAINNRSIGYLILEDITPLPAGAVEIEVLFDIDAAGSLKVLAAEKATGKTVSARIEVASDLSEDQKDLEMSSIKDV